MNNILWYYTNPGVDDNGQPKMPISDPGKLKLFNRLYQEALQSASKSSDYFSTQKDYRGYGYACSEAQAYAWDLADTAINLNIYCVVEDDGVATISGYVSDAFYYEEYLAPVTGVPIQ